MDNKYEIKLGVSLDTSDLKQQINQINNGKHKIDLGVDLKVNDIRDRIKAYNNNANNAKVKLGVKLDTSDIKQQIKNLNLSGLSKSQGMNVAVNTESLEKSLNEVKDVIADIRTALGSLSGDGMKDIVSSINQMATALGKAENESDSLVKSLSALSKKDFSFNIGLDLGKKGSNNMIAYGRTARRQIIPELESQIKELENMLGGTGKAFGKASKHLDVYEYGANMGSNKIVQRMEAMEDYIVAMKKIASAEGINLDGFDKIHRNASELINDVTGVESAVDKAGDVPEKLKNIFGGSVDGDNLSKQLDSVVADLGEIRTAIQSLSSGASLDGLIQSFNRLSDVLDKLDANFDRIKNAFNGNFIDSGITQSVGKAEQKVVDVSDSVTSEIVKNEKRKQEAYKATTDTVLYHAGVVSRLNKAETNGRFYGSNRGTGYFGTGHYFTDYDTKHELDNNSNFNQLPYTSVDISHYDNLFKVSSDEIGYALHGFLRNLTRFTQGIDDYDVSELFAQFKKVFNDTTMDIAEFGTRVDQLKNFMQNSDFYDRSDSVSTQFMKSLGYGGVDTRGTRLADTEYGTVIYDLKEESILQANITDELQKQGEMLEKINYEKGQVFDKDTDAKIQSKIDEQNKQKEIIDEYNKIYDSTALNSYESELDDINNTLKKNAEAMDYYKDSIANAEKKARDFLNTQKMLEDDWLGDDWLDDDFLFGNKTVKEYDLDESEVEKKKNEIIKGYQQDIADLEAELPSLESRKRELEDVVASEEELSRKAYKQAKQIVAQRYPNDNILNSFRDSLRNIGMDSEQIDTVADRIKNLGVQIETLNQKKSTRKIFDEDGNEIEKEILNVDVSGVDKFGNAIKLTQQYDMATGELIKSIDKVSTVQQKAGTSTDKFVKQQKMAVSNLSNQVKQLHSSAIDQNASRPIKETAHLDALKSKYKEIEDAIEVMGNASNEAFTEEQVKVKGLITDYKIMKNEFKNAGNVSNSLKGTDFKSGLEIAKNDLEKFKANASDFPQITKTIEELDRAIASVGDKSSLDSFTDQLKVARAELAKVKAETIATNRKEKVGINVSGVTSQIANIQRISPEINEFKTVIDGAEVSVESLLNDLSRVNTAGDFSVVKARFKAFEDAAESAGIAITEVVTKASTIDKIKFKISDTGFNGFTQEVARAHAETEKLELASDGLIKALKELDIAMENVYSANASGDIKALVSANEQYEKSLKQVHSQLKLNQQAEKDAYNAEMLDQRRTALSSDMEIWLKENTRATRDFGEEIRKLQGSLNGLDDRGLRLAGKQFTNIKKQAQVMGKTGLTVFDQLKAKAAQYASYLSAAEIFMYAEQAFRSMFEQVKLIDSAMTELKKVTDETNASYDKFLTNASTRAREIGTTIDGLVSSTADFARLGYGFEDAQGLAEVANIYAVVGDEIEGVEGATQNLISTLAAFKDEMNGMSNTDFAMSIIDSLNEVGNNFSISSGGLGEALKRSASSLAAGNNTLHESVALITAANEVTQNPDKVGNAMKTVSMRIRSAKSEMEELGEDTDGMVESTATLRAEIKALSGVDIMIDNSTFKSTYQILDEISNKWEDLSDISQATIIEKLAGKHQGNVFASLMENFSTAREVVETSLNSSGSAMQEHEKWSQSLEAQLLKLKASWQGLSQTFLNSDFLKSALNGLINLTDGATKLIDTVGTIPTLVGTLATGMSVFKNTGIFRTLTTDLDGFINKVGIASKSFAELANAFNFANTGGAKGFFKGLSAMKNSLSSGLTKADISNIKAYNNEIKNGTSAQTAWYRTMQTSSSAAQNLVASAKGGEVALNRMKSATIGSKVALIGAKAAAVAFNAALTMGISLLIDWAVSGIQKVLNAEKELSEEVEELTSKYREQHEELRKLQGDYDTSNESSMISKYEKLSKGVDSLGRNISLTADEYSEYQSIVNQIANQTPSLVSGYDEQGNAILNVKGNVEGLTKAYEKLIHTQNQEVLGKTGKIEKDFKNTLKEADVGGWRTFWRTVLPGGKTGKEIDSDAIKFLEDVYSGKSIDKDDIKGFGSGSQLEEALKKANVEIEGSWMWDTPAERVAKTLSKLMKTKDGASKIRTIIDNYYTQFSDEVEKQKTTAQAVLSEAFDISSAISGLDYGNISEEMQNIAYQTVNSLDFDFLSKLQDKDKTLEQWTKEMLDQLNSISKEDNAEIEAAFDLQTKFNGGEISYGEYVQKLKDVESTIDGLKLKDTAKNQLKLSLGLDDNGLFDQYDKLKERLIKVSTKDIKSQGHFTGADYVLRDAIKEAEEFLDNMTASEYAVAVKLIADDEIDLNNFDIKSLRAKIEKEAKINEALNYTIAIDVETEGLTAFNTAMTESVTGAGLSSESITALKGRYAELEAEGYNLSAMFEETSNGIHLNREAVSELEQAYAKQKLSETDSQLKVLKGRYDELSTEINNCTDASKRASLYTEQQSIIDKINDLGTLAAQYEGLTSAYNQWQSAESAGQERDMYEGIISGFENVKDEISRGWIDDGTTEFLELLTGKADLAGKSGKELKKIYDDLDNTIKNTTYSIRDFFTVDEDGNSTNTGVYNFLDAIGQLEEENFGGKDVVKRDKSGNIIGFDFELVAKKDKDGNVIKNGDQVIAETLGISEELVQIMVRASDDAGFVINLEGAYTQLADLKTEAESARDTLISLQKKGLGQLKGTDVNFDLNAKGNDLVKEQKEAVKLLNKFKKDGKIDLTMTGAQQALDIAEYLTIKLDDLTEPKFMQIDTSEVEEDLRDPIEKIQEIGDLCKEKHLVSLTGDTKELKEVQDDINKVAKEIEELDPEIKAQIGIDEDWNAKTIADKIDSGELEIPAELKLDVQMSDDLKDMRLMMMNQLGLITDEEVKLKVGFDIDESLVDSLDDKQQKVVVEYVTKNKEEFDKLTEKEKKVVVNLVANGVDLEKYEPEDKKAIVNYMADGKEVDGWTPEAKDAFVKYLADGGEIDKFDPKNKESWVVYDVDTTKPDKYNPDTEGTVTFEKDSSAIDSWKPTVTGVAKFVLSMIIPQAVRNALAAVGISIANGTANVDGTAFANGSATKLNLTGQAFARGNWRTKNTQTALTGELGREIVVTPDNRWYTVGDSGAEFTTIPKGSIVFNHRQTEELFKNGKVTSGGGRGRALASGTAFRGGSYGSGGGLDVDVKDYVAGNNPNSKKKSSKSKSSSSKSSSSDSAEEFKEVIDWIEIALKRVQREIDNLDQKANNIYKSWTSRNTALSQEISKVGSEINLQQQAYNRYIKEANSVGLSSSLAKRVRDGAIDIDTITDENLKEKIDNYKNWYEKALDCKDAIEELKETEASLYRQRFDNVQTQYDAILQGYEHTETMLNEYISQAEEQGHIVSKKYYNALINNEKDNIAKLKQEQSALIKARDEAVASGTIKKASEDWYNMCNEIDSVTQAIEESTTALLEFDNAIREIDWSVFDLIQERISDVSEEADFLIELMSNDKLFDDKGVLSEQGAATLGLHAQKYNDYMYQSDDYGNEVAKLDKQIAKDPYDQELINRRQELLELQREMILNAEQEKEAIRDLVEEGINLELDALNEKIQKYEEAIDSQKD